MKMRVFSFVKIACGLIFVLVFSSVFFRSSKVESSPTLEKDSFDLSNYDIRLDPRARETISRFINESAKSPSSIASDRENAFRAEQRLRAAKENLKIEYNEDLRIPEVIAPDFARQKPEFVTAPSSENRADLLKKFVDQNAALFGLNRAQISRLEKTADYTNPDGNLSFVHFQQKINSIPVFRGEVKAGFTQKNEIVRVINNLAPNLDHESLETNGGSAEQAVLDAANHIDLRATEADLKRIELASNDLKVTFERGQFDNDTIAEKIYFPIDHGVARFAWRVLLWRKTDAFYVIVDARDGTLLWRKNITSNQTQQATYGIYGWLFNFVRTADSPTPMTPGCTNPGICPEPTPISRGTISLVGNDTQDYSFNNLGWIPDTGLPVRMPPDPNVTDGNAVEAGLDRVAPNGVDAPVSGNPNRVFNFAYNPAPGNPPPAQDPLSPEYQKGSVTQAFYVVNRWHDEMYRLGFTEPAGNFQHFNFGRGGSEGDRVSAEVQDASGTNGANMSVPADGGRPRLQMFIWTGTTPNRDGALDSHGVLHELTHGVSTRLHGNGSGLGNPMGAGMGEGWSDFYALALLSDFTENLSGTYPVGSYAIFGILPGGGDYYYGLRRFPTALRAFRGANGFPHNPLTFANLNAGNCASFESAFPPRIFSTDCDQIHNIGEVWTAALWEIRARFINRRGFSGNQRIMQIVTDGMKLAPLNPNFLQERDAMVAAAFANPNPREAGVDAADVIRGFAVRGLGYGATINSPNPVNITESFNLPPNLLRPKRADFDGDGKTDVSVFRPGEGNWYLNRSTAGFTAINWGLSTDVPVPADYDGDGKTDIAVFRGTADAAQPDFYILNSSNFTYSGYGWGVPGDIPMVEDYDNDGRDDVAVFRPSEGQFYGLRSQSGTVFLEQLGLPYNYKLVSGDFDGDGKGDIAYFKNGQWFIVESGQVNAGFRVFNWGIAGDTPVPADYDGDNIDDLGVYRASEGNWYIRRASGGTISAHFGIATDIPVPGDYDGDGRNDIAVYRDGTWYINQTTSGLLITQFGLNGDVPIPNRYFP